MNFAPPNYNGGFGGVLVKSDIPSSAIRGRLLLGDPRNARPSKQLRYKYQSHQSERDISTLQDKPIETNFGEILLPPHQHEEQDTFLDNDVGGTIRYIKEHFGDAPLIKAYDAAMCALDESDRRWKEYWEEEARRQAIFEEDEDSVL